MPVVVSRLPMISAPSLGYVRRGKKHRELIAQKYPCLKLLKYFLGSDVQIGLLLRFFPLGLQF